MTPRYIEGPSPHRCGLHGGLLVDLREQDGSLSRCCPDCVDIRLVDVVRQIHEVRESGGVKSQ